MKGWHLIVAIIIAYLVGSYLPVKGVVEKVKGATGQ